MRQISRPETSVLNVGRPHNNQQGIRIQFNCWGSLNIINHTKLCNGEIQTSFIVLPLVWATFLCALWMLPISVFLSLKFNHKNLGALKLGTSGNVSNAFIQVRVGSHAAAIYFVYMYIWYAICLGIKIDVVTYCFSGLVIIASGCVCRFISDNAKQRLVSVTALRAVKLILKYTIDLHLFFQVFILNISVRKIRLSFENVNDSFRGEVRWICTGLIYVQVVMSLTKLA